MNELWCRSESEADADSVTSNIVQLIDTSTDSAGQYLTSISDICLAER